MKKGLVIVIIIIAVIAVCIIAGVSIHNSLVAQQAACDEQLANIDAQLQRRIDLIPNLIAAVKDFAAHETEVFSAVTASREALIAARTPQAKAEADAALTDALGRLVVIAEAYPTLTSDSVYTGLMDELAGTENRIAVARTNYNQAASTYNAAIKKFPAMLFASALGFERYPLFQAAAGADAVPAVDLG